MAKKATPKEKKKRKERNLVEATSEEEGGNRIRGPGRRWQRWRSASVSALLQYSLSTCYHLQSFDFIPEADQAEYADNRPLGLPNTCDLLINGAAYTLFRQFPWITSPSGPQFDSLEVQKFSTTAKWKFASRYYSGMHSTIWKCKLYCSGVRKIVWDMSAGVRGSSRHTKFFTLAKFWMSDDREMTKGLLSNVETLRFNHSFGCPRSRTWRKGCSDHVPTPNKERKKFLKRRRLFEEQPFSAAILSTFLSRHPQQPSFAAILAAILKLLVILLWSVVGGQLLVNHRTSIWGGHGLVVGYFSTIEHQLLVVNFLWSSMNEFLERTPWQRFRERRVSALNPMQSCRLAGWKHENLPVLASFWPTTANPPLNQSIYLNLESSLHA